VVKGDPALQKRPEGIVLGRAEEVVPVAVEMEIQDVANRGGVGGIQESVFGSGGEAFTVLSGEDEEEGR